MLASFGEDPETGQKLRPKLRSFNGNAADAMADLAESLARDPHRNIYAPLALMRPDLPLGLKGGETDVLHVLGLVADFDDGDAHNYQTRLPLPADYVLQTSEGRYQCFYLFEEPLAPVEAKPLAAALCEYSGCDHGTKDLSHVWRVDGSLNWPNSKKVDAGRSPEPQQVKSVEEWGGTFTDPAELRRVLGSDALNAVVAASDSGALARARVTTVDLSDLDDDLRERIEEPTPVGQRSEAFYGVVHSLAEIGFGEAEIVAICEANPVGEKYEGRILQEVRRALGKTGDDEPVGVPINTEAPISAQPGAQRRPKPRPPLPVIYFDDAETQVETNDFVEDLLTHNGLSVTYGESGCGKSFFMTDLGFHVAMGRQWRDREVDKFGVVYVAAEGGGYGIKNRIAALKQHHVIAETVPFAIVPCSIDLLNPKADTDRLIERIKADSKYFDLTVGLVVIDTLSRALAGGNESSSDDMGALVINADKVRAETGAHVAFVHHSGKDASRGSRGWSGLRAAIDTEIEVQRDETTSVSTATVTKQRDLETVGEFSFSLQVVELGENKRGKQVTSCVVVDAEGSARRGKKNSPTRQEQLALEQLDRCLIDLGVPAPGTSHFPSNGPVRVVTREQWRDFCFRGGVTKSDKPDSASRAFLRHLQNLTAKGIIGEWDDLIWRADKVGQDRTNDFLSEGQDRTDTDTTL